MTAPIFEEYLIVDWSASNQPTRGKDSIWIAHARRGARGNSLSPPLNPATRSEAMARIEDVIGKALAAGRRVFVGFDFPFGYPKGAARELSGRDGWDALWRLFSEQIEDGADNRSNRFDFAARMNRLHLASPRFWGRPHQRAIDGLPARKPPPEAFAGREFRRIEGWQPRAKSVWQLAYNGAVGSQALVGIARLQALKRALGDAIAIWPFETHFAERLTAPVILGEIYPSMFPVAAETGEVRDAAQVRTLAQEFAARDAAGRFREFLARPPALGDDDAAIVIAEEGWMVGAIEPAQQRVRARARP